MEQATSSSNDRHQRALVAYIRQEFEAPVAAILGYAEMISRRRHDARPRFHSKRSSAAASGRV